MAAVVLLVPFLLSCDNSTGPCREAIVVLDLLLSSRVISQDDTLRAESTVTNLGPVPVNYIEDGCGWGARLEIHGPSGEPVAETMCLIAAPPYGVELRDQVLRNQLEFCGEEKAPGEYSVVARFTYYYDDVTEGVNLEERETFQVVESSSKRLCSGGPDKAIQTARLLTDR